MLSTPYTTSPPPLRGETGGDVPRRAEGSGLARLLSTVLVNSERQQPSVSTLQAAPHSSFSVTRGLATHRCASVVAIAAQAALGAPPLCASLQCAPSCTGDFGPARSALPTPRPRKPVPEDGGGESF